MCLVRSIQHLTKGGMVLVSCIIMGCHGWQVKLTKSSRVKEIESNSPRSCCQGDRKILIYMKKTYKTILKKEM
jgi:hypothetical protein